MLWIISMLFLFCKAYETFHHDDSFYYLRKILGRGLCISRGTAPIMNLIVVLIMLPVCKTFNKLVHKILSKLSVQLLAYYLEKLKIIHLCLAVTLVFTAVIHSLAHFWNIINFIGNYDSRFQEINWAKDETDNMFRLLFATPTGFSGIIMLACLIIMWIFSTRQMRNFFYNSFLGVHHLFLLFYVMMYYHPLSDIIKYQSNLEEYRPACDFAFDLFNNSEAMNFTSYHCQGVPKFTAGPKNFWIWPTVALFIYFFDLSFRYFKRCFKRLKPISMEPSTKSCMLMTFKLNDSISVRPGQYILLQCENLSKLEWHPFTITDFIHCPKKTILTVAIAVRGDWTYELYRRVLEHKTYSQLSRRRRSRNMRRSKNSIPRKLLFILDGPFPSPMESIIAHEKVILIAAGIGITPFISIFNYMLKTTKMLPLKRIHLVWVSKDVEQFTLFSDILSSLTQTFWNENKPDKFQIRLYLTQSNNKPRTRRISFPDEEDPLNDNELFGNNADFITSRLYSGRPNWSYLFNYWTSLYQKDIINVYSCGPKTLNKEVRQYCQKYNKRGYNYRYLHEAFS
ncbi:unnamed protein product [Diamesa tonsa]